jgi:hypothetical protein
MRQSVCVEDLQVDDTIPGVGKIVTVTRDGQDVHLTLKFATIKALDLGCEDVVFVDRG